MSLVFPNVPAVPGVPPLPVPVGFIPPPPPVLLTSDASGLALEAANPVQWGIYHQDGTPVVPADCVASFEYRQDWQISDYQIEKGTFTSYNKVQTPFAGRVSYAAGLSDNDRTSLLNAVDAAANSLEIFDIYTPEKIYSGVSIDHYDQRRTSRNGVGLLVVDVWCVQVRELAQTTFSSTAAPSGATSQDKGTVQTETPSHSQSDLVSSSTPSAQHGATGQWHQYGATGEW